MPPLWRRAVIAVHVVLTVAVGIGLAHVSADVGHAASVARGVDIGEPPGASGSADHHDAPRESSCGDSDPGAFCTGPTALAANPAALVLLLSAEIVDGRSRPVATAAPWGDALLEKHALTVVLRV
jgi:hypothetical protein